MHADSGGTTTVVATATVGPGSVVDIPVELDGLPLPIDVSVTGDNGFPTTPIGPPIFGCPSRFDLSVTTPESTPVVVSLPGPCYPTTDPSHGTIETTRWDAGPLLGEFLYTPNPGFVGEDTFDYDCVISASAFGTVSVTVTAAPSPPSPPRWSRPSPAEARATPLGITAELTRCVRTGSTGMRTTIDMPCASGQDAPLVLVNPSSRVVRHCAMSRHVLGRGTSADGPSRRWLTGGRPVAG